MNGELLRPWGDCETHAYAKSSQDEFHYKTRMLVPAGYEGVAYRDMHTFETLYPGEYALCDKLTSVRRGLGRSRLRGRVAYINKALSYKVDWGTGKPVVYLDPALERAMSAGFSGSFTVKVDMTEAFLQYAHASGLDKLQLKEIVNERAQAFIACLNPALKHYIEDKGLDFRSIPARLTEISASAQARVRQAFAPAGLWVSDFAITGQTFPDQ